MCGAAGAARSAKSCSLSGLRLLGLFADADQFRAGRLRKYKAIRGNRLIERGLHDRNLQLIVVTGPAPATLPGVVKIAESVPLTVRVVGNQRATGGVGLNSRDIQIGGVEPDFLRDFEFVGLTFRLRTIVAD